MLLIATVNIQKRHQARLESLTGRRQLQRHHLSAFMHPTNQRTPREEIVASLPVRLSRFGCDRSAVLRLAIGFALLRGEVRLGYVAFLLQNFSSLQLSYILVFCFFLQSCRAVKKCSAELSLVVFSQENCD